MLILQEGCSFRARLFFDEFSRAWVSSSMMYDEACC